MNINAHLGISVNALVKFLIDKTANHCAVLEVQLTSRFHETPLKKHTFLLIKSEENGRPHKLVYNTTDNCGESMSFAYSLDSLPSNLPNCGADRWYIYHFKSRKHVQKLHLHQFANGVFYFCRHEYKHLYDGQRLSRRDRTLQYHEYERKIERLKNSLKKLRLTYDGKPTRTAERLEYYEERAEHFEGLAFFELKKFTDRFGTRF